jgi:hypothetical protein
MGLSFIVAAGPRQRCHSQGRVSRNSWPHFTVSDSRLPNLEARSPYLYLQEQGSLVIPPGLGSLFVTSYDSQGYRGGVRPCLYTGPDTDCTENVFSIIACSLVARETKCPQRCSLATAVVLSPVHTSVTWKWVSTSPYYTTKTKARGLAYYLACNSVPLSSSSTP